jgi:anaerobic carbon-monoxide dehydrogenase iron sulfur subunit
MRTLEKILVQRELCDGCLDCEHACNSIHNTSRIKILEYDSSYYPIICQQCEDAPCEKICPTEAMGPVKVDSEKCISCGLCSMVCPFGAINLVEKTAEKCDQCIDREEGPACIKACSKRAISKVDIEKLKEDKQEKYIAKLSGKPTKPKKNSIISIIAGRNRS